MTVTGERKPQDVRRQQILEVSAGLFARQGVSATTVRQIGAEVGMKSGSLYHHFESKDSILVELLGAYMEELHSAYLSVLVEAREADERLHRLLEVSLDVAMRHRDAAILYQLEIEYLRSSKESFAEILAMGRRVQRIWLDTIETGVRDGVFRSDVSSEVFYRMLRDSLWLSLRWYRETDEYRSTDLARDFSVVFLEGFRGR